MRILMLEPYPTIQGPLPKIVPLLMDALRQSGIQVFSEYWGRHVEKEPFRDKLLGRIADIWRIRATLLRFPSPLEVLYVTSAHDWNTITRDAALLLAARGLFQRAIVQIHGSFLDRIQEPGHKGFKMATRLLFRLCDGVIVSSSEESRAFSQFQPGGRFFVADNIYQPGLSPAKLAIPADWGLPADRPIIFFAARLIPEKGILDLLEAMTLVLPQVPCHLLVAGVGPLEEELRERLARPPLTGHASWVRYLDRAHLELAFSLTSIFVLPTYHIEGFPAVIQDALGHGLPIITTPIRGVADHLVDGIHARLIPPKNPAKLAQTLVELLEDPAECRRMAAANTEKAKDFSPEKVARHYLRILQEISQTT